MSESKIDIIFHPFNLFHLCGFLYRLCVNFLEKLFQIRFLQLDLRGP